MELLKINKKREMQRKPMDDRFFAINLIWDSKEAKWIAKIEDVPALVLEAVSLDGLIDGLKDAVPELTELKSVMGK